ncbi:phosphatidylinositol phosphatase PTPRQ [Anopheles darlingi]|uniref:phosphatidylinositol phosphatase PTPRQ n=1 Tax=Anopheles darlingi TaxID=43151 RepID=UPI0020FFF779|nr:phosphatidylinositol phosphatase PTPRQ [Anopheles darlingi]
MVKRHFSRLGVLLCCLVTVTYLQRYHQLPTIVIAGDTNEQWMSSTRGSDVGSGHSDATQTESLYERTNVQHSFIEISPKCKSTRITVVERRDPDGELGIEWLGEPDLTAKHFYNITWIDSSVGRKVNRSGGIYKLTTFALPTRNWCEIVELSVCRGDWRKSQPCVCGIWTPPVDALNAVTAVKVSDGGYIVSWKPSKCVKKYELRPGYLTLQSTNPVAVKMFNVRDCQWNRFVVEVVMQNGVIGQQEVQFYGYPQLADPQQAICVISKIRNATELWKVSTLELSKGELSIAQLEHYMTSCRTPTTVEYLDLCSVQSVQRSNQVRKADALPHVIPPFCPMSAAHPGDVTVKPTIIGEVRDLRANTDLDRTVILSWRPPREGKVCVKEYIITWASESEIVDAERTTYTVTNLEPCTTYNFTVSAIDHSNAKGTPSSVEARVREIEQLSEVVELELYEVEPRSLSAKWKPPLNGTNCVQSYRVAAWYNSPEDASVVLVFSNTTTDQHVTFGEAIACMSYMVQVIPISFQNKDGRNEIAPLKTKERTILPYHVEPIRAIGVRSRSLELSTKLQSDNNNNCLLVSVRFNCTIVPEAEDSAPELPVIKEFAIPSGNVSFEGVVEPLVPYTVYQCNAQILNIAGWSDPTPSYEIQTAEDVPDSPRGVQLIAGSGLIEITWKAPAVKNGVVVRYRIHIRMIGPEYPMPKLCDQLEEYNETVDLRDEIDPDETIHRSWDGSEFQYTITQLAPYTLYTVQVAAATGAGVGPYSEPSEIVTLPDVPSEPRNFRIEQIKGPELDQAYSSSVEFSWEIPCRLNGKLNRFEGTLSGVRETDNSVPHVLRWVVEVSEESDPLEPFRYIETRLKPEYVYTVAMNVAVAEVPEPSPDAQLTFESPAGIPTIDQTDDWFKVDVFDAPNPTNTARIVLGNITLKSDIGSIRYVALLVSERFCQIDPEPRTDFINSEGTTQWPEVPDWHRVNNMRCTEQYQTTPKFWNPLLHLSRAKSNPVEFVVGEERCDNGKEYCNGPLKPGTEYALVVRIFSRTGFTDSELQFFRTDSLIMVGLIISSIVACCLLAFISGLVILWRRQRLLLPAQLAGRAPSEEPSDIPLKNFPNQYDELFQSNREKVSKEFQAINYFSDTVLQETVSYHSARENERKNRYVNILPYDSNRVLLDSNEEEDEYDGRSGNDYINASFIEGYKYQREYIATQGPKLETCADFWRMVIQYEIEAIVMLTQPIDHEKNKCCQYYPRYQQKIRFNDIRVECKQELKLLFYHKRLFEVTQGNLTKLVFHYHFLEWPDHSCPASPTDLVKFTKIIRAERKSYAIPLVVHCSAGVGRTGTFIALDIILQRMQNEKKINVYDTVKQLRRQRVKMVQTLDQYTFLYQCCLEQVSKSNRKKPKSSFIEIVDRESHGKHAPLATVIEVEQPGVAVSNGGKPLFNIKFPKSFNAGLEKVTSFAPSDIAGSGT